MYQQEITNAMISGAALGFVIGVVVTLTVLIIIIGLSMRNKG